MAEPTMEQWVPMGYVAALEMFTLKEVSSFCNVKANKYGEHVFTINMQLCYQKPSC